MSWGAVAGAVIGGVIASRSTRRAQDVQTGAAEDATQLQREQFERVNAQQEPWRAAGGTALGELMGMRGFDPTPSAASVMADPGYEFGRSEGIRGIEHGAAARGMGQSGAALRALSRFNSDYAGTRYNDAFNRQHAQFNNRWGRLSELAGIGQTANKQTNQAGANFANQAGQNMMGGANAGAASQITRGNIWANAANQGASLWGRNQNRGTVGDRSNFRFDDPYRNPNYYSGDEGE